MESEDDTVDNKQERLVGSNESIALLVKPNTVLQESKKWPQHLAAMLGKPIPFYMY